MFDGDAAVAGQQPAPEFALFRVCGREAEMAAFAGDDADGRHPPDQAGDAEAGAGAENDFGGAWAMGWPGCRCGCPGSSTAAAVGGSGEIVEQRNPADAESILQRRHPAATAGRSALVCRPSVGPATPKAGAAMAGWSG